MKKRRREMRRARKKERRSSPPGVLNEGSKSLRADVLFISSWEWALELDILSIFVCILYI